MHVLLLTVARLPCQYHGMRHLFDKIHWKMKTNAALLASFHNPIGKS